MLKSITITRSDVQFMHTRKIETKQFKLSSDGNASYMEKERQYRDIIIEGEKNYDQSSVTHKKNIYRSKAGKLLEECEKAFDRCVDESMPVSYDDSDTTVVFRYDDGRVLHGKVVFTDENQGQTIHKLYDKISDCIGWVIFLDD